MDVKQSTHSLVNSHLRFGLLTLNRPKALNSLNLEMVQQLYQQLSTWQEDESVAFVVIQGEGDRAFCAGGDISALYHSIVANPDQVLSTEHYVYQFFKTEYQLNALIHFYTKPIVALGQGVLMGGGVGLYMGASHRLVFPTTRYAMPEVAIGLYPDVAGTWLFNRLPKGIGAYLALTGSSMNGADCGFLGLADAYIDSHNATEIVSLLSDFSYNDTDTAQTNLNRLFSALKTPWQLEQSPIVQHFDALQSLSFSASVSEFKTKLQRSSEDSASDFLNKGVKALAYASPLSVEISWWLLQEHRHASVLEVLERDFWVSLQCCAKGDFKEGVRALLIDKDRRPQWQDATTVSPHKVHKFCQPNWGSVAALSL